MGMERTVYDDADKKIVVSHNSEKVVVRDDGWDVWGFELTPLEARQMAAVLTEHARYVEESR